MVSTLFHTNIHFSPKPYISHEISIYPHPHPAFSIGKNLILGGHPTI
jgi:hypothetical protein